MPTMRPRFPAAHCPACAGARLGFIHCHRCGLDKPTQEFYRDRSRGSDAYHSGCKSCRRRQSLRYSRQLASLKGGKP